jgi:hypothetical protein
MQAVYYDPNKCMSIRARHQNIQCCYDKKANSDYCGIHTRSNHIVRIDSIFGAQPIAAAPVAVQEVVPGPVEEPVQEAAPVAAPVAVQQAVEALIKKKKSASKQKNSDIYTYHDIKAKTRINNEKLERSCEFYGIAYNAEAPRDSYKALKRLINKRVEPYLSHEGSIVRIQKVFKGWNIRRRRNCNNKEDCGTMDVLFEIPIQYYIDYKDDDGFTYGFDIRSLHMIMAEANPINPFTQKQLILGASGQNFFEKYMKKMTAVKEKEGAVKFDSPKLTKEQRFNQTLIRVFQKIDMLGHYTDIAWFQNMSLRDLNNFYKGLYDIFTFRVQLSQEVRRKIVRDGILFQNFIGNLHHIQERNKHILQYEILREIERILDEGEDRDSKILGIILVLTVLVECSYAAALDLPHFVQSSFA